MPRAPERGDCSGGAGGNMASCIRLLPNSFRPLRAHPDEHWRARARAGYGGGGRSGRQGAEGGADTDGVLPAAARRGARYSTLCALVLAHNACQPVINLLLKGRVPRRMPSRSRSKSSTRSGTDAKKKSRSRSPAAKGHKSRSRSPAKDTKDKEVPRKRDETPPNVKAARLTVQNLTRNVGGEHLKEIFGTFG